MKKVAIVLAAGKGVRMKSDLPKVAHMISGRPMISRVLEALKPLKLDDVFVVVGYQADVVRKACEGFRVTFVEQKEQLGTGHAVAQAKGFIKDSIVIVLNGDVPLIKTDTLQGLVDLHIYNKAAATVLTAHVDDPSSYGRIIRTADGGVERIVEQKDATDVQKMIREVNTGTYCFNSSDLFSALDMVRPNNAQKEFYLTDVISILRNTGKTVCAHMVKDSTQVLGVNTIDELAKLEGIFNSAL